MKTKATERLDVVESPSVKDEANSPHFPIPNLIFSNRTALDAIQFDVVDQHSSPFHVVVAKATYAIGLSDKNGTAALAISDNPTQLSATDVYRGDSSDTGLLKESDFAPFKPACDVIVNATACAPGGKLVRSFSVRLTVDQMTATEDIQGAAEVLIDKSLVVSGEREFRRIGRIARVFNWLVTVATLGLLRPLSWRLTTPDQFSDLPLGYEFAFGGECRLNADDPAEKCVSNEERLEQGKELVAEESCAKVIEQDACETNPIGRGFVRHWYLNARRVTRVLAPRVTYLAHPFTARDFWRGAGGETLPPPAGFGAIERGWLPRRALAGRIEEKAMWDPDEVPRLPPDFDFSYWNCAPLDQQCKYLSDTARITLVNLCRSDHPAATVDDSGNTHLRIQLPLQKMFLLCVDREEKLMVKRLEVDTVFVDPTARQLELVWRVCLSADGGVREARLFQATEPAQLERLRSIEEAQVAAVEIADSSDCSSIESTTRD